MIKRCFLDAFQGHRWCFKAHTYDEDFDMIDTRSEFPPITISRDMAEILSQQLGDLQQYQNNDREMLLIPKLLLDFVKENKDIDKDIIITLINKIGE